MLFYTDMLDEVWEIGSQVTLIPLNPHFVPLYKAVSGRMFGGDFPGFFPVVVRTIVPFTRCKSWKLYAFVLREPLRLMLSAPFPFMRSSRGFTLICRHGAAVLRHAVGFLVKNNKLGEPWWPEPPAMGINRKCISGLFVLLSWVCFITTFFAFSRDSACTMNQEKYV